MKFFKKIHPTFWPLEKGLFAKRRRRRWCLGAEGAQAQACGRRRRPLGRRRRQWGAEEHQLYSHGITKYVRYCRFDYTLLL